MNKKDIFRKLYDNIDAAAFIINDDCCCKFRDKNNFPAFVHICISQNTKTFKDVEYTIIPIDKNRKATGPPNDIAQSKNRDLFQNNRYQIKSVLLINKFIINNVSDF
ncbi:MAG: hypothetical protein V1720_12140 [bacterium]